MIYANREPGSIEERIKRTRENFEPPLNKTTLSKLSGVSLNILKKIETQEDAKLSKIDDLLKLADALNVSPCYLLTGYSEKTHEISAVDLGFSEETITRIMNLDKREKKLIELLINDPGEKLTGEKDLGTSSMSFLEILSRFMINNEAIRVIDPDTGLQAPHKLVLSLDNDICMHPTELNPVSMYQDDIITRLAIIRHRYLARAKRVKEEKES